MRGSSLIMIEAFFVKSVTALLRYCVSMFDCNMFFYSLKLNLTVSNIDLVTLQRISEDVKEVSGSCLSDKMRTGKMPKGCKNWLTNCKTKFANIKGTLIA